MINLQNLTHATQGGDIRRLPLYFSVAIVIRSLDPHLWGGGTLWVDVFTRFAT
jgi:hypothetical protein